MPPKKHATLGASKSKRWMHCPGSIRLEADAPFQETSEYALEGSAAHEVAETCLADGTMAEEYVGKIISVPVRLEDGERMEEVTVTEGMAEAVQVYVDYCRGLAPAVHPEGTAEYEHFIEQRVDLAPLNPPAPMYGTADFVVWNESTKTLEVVDYKHGRGVAVDAAGNPQLLYYALGAVVALRKKPEHIRVTIVQPRGFHPDGTIRTAVYGWEELKAFKERLFEAAEVTQQDDAPLQVGDWCRFCPALATCPAQRENAIEVAQSEFDVEPEFSPPAPEALTPEQFQLVLERGDAVMDWIRAVHEHAIHLLDTGHDVPGYKLVEGRSHRRWTDEEAAEKYLANKRLKKDERLKMKVISPAQAEKKLKAMGKLDRARKLDELIEKPEGKPKLVPVDDPRPALVPSAQEDFDVLSEST